MNTVKERVRALRYFEKQKRHPEQAKKLGIEIEMKEKGETYALLRRD